jgi:hypothetical protein
MDAINAKDSYRIFLQVCAEQGYEFTQILDDAKRIASYDWVTPKLVSTEVLSACASFNFIRRQSWLQISLFWRIDNVPVKVNGEPTKIGIGMSAGNLFQEFKEDHPKTEAGVRSAALEIMSHLVV